MKHRIIFLILTFVLLASFCVLPVFAASATANVTSVSGNRDATVTVSITLAEGAMVGSGGIELIYDSAILELIKGEWNVSGTTLSNFNPSNGKGAFAYASEAQISGNVFTATFKIKSNAAFGDSAVKMRLQLKNSANADISVTNNAGKVTVTCKHSYSAWSSANSSSHTHACSICGDVETKNHAFDNACDTKCDTCGYTRTTIHNYKTAWSSNGSQHWHECSVCKEKKDAAPHTPGAAATETTPQTCTTCQRVLVEAMGHTHSYDSTWSSNANEHWRVCTACNQGSSAEVHSYDNSCDISCNTCGYVRNVAHTFGSNFLSDGESHWYLCSVCETLSEKVAHTYDNGCDTDCNDCAHSRVTEHNFDAGVVTEMPTADGTGEKTYTCSVCGVTKTVELEYYVPKMPETGATTEDTPSVSDAQDGVFSIVSLLIGVAIGAVAGVGGMKFIRKKK